jgi:SAM-dependent methyltransferase
MIYDAWKHIEPKSIPGNTPISDNIFDYVMRESRILEIGCGIWRLSDYFTSFGCKYCGIDINEQAIAEAKKKENSKKTFYVKNAEQMDFPEGSFDIILSQGTLACMNLEGRINVCNESFRILRCGGIMHVAELDLIADDKYYQSQAKITGEYGTVVQRQDGSEIGYKTHHFKTDELKGLFASPWKFESEEHIQKISKNGNLYPMQMLIFKK